MAHVGRVPLPRAPEGPVEWAALVPWMDAITREILARFDARNANSDFSAGILANSDGSVTVGNEAYPTGRVASVPTLTSRIGNQGRALNQTFGWPVMHANRNSVQDTDTVLVATSSDTASQIEVQAHGVKFDFGSVAYAGGTISGLNPETLYYVYADDANFDGGSVAYYATTNPDNLIVQGRYYLGYIVTPVLATSADVTDATSANPIEVTTDGAHGWTTGDTVDFASMPGDFAVLNSGTHAITVTNTDKFTVAVDGGAFAAYSSGGSATRVSTQTESGGGAGAGVGGGRFDLTVLP